jgi:hypothetical protein
MKRNRAAQRGAAVNLFPHACAWPDVPAIDEGPVLADCGE